MYINGSVYKDTAWAERKRTAKMSKACLDTRRDAHGTTIVTVDPIPPQSRQLILLHPSCPFLPIYPVTSSSHRRRSVLQGKHTKTRNREEPSKGSGNQEEPVKRVRKPA